MELAVVIDAVVVLAAAGLTLLLPRRDPARPGPWRVAGEPVAREPAQYGAGAH
jgi:hypothetical protein